MFFLWTKFCRWKNKNAHFSCKQHGICHQKWKKKHCSKQWKLLKLAKKWHLSTDVILKLQNAMYCCILICFDWQFFLKLFVNEKQYHNTFQEKYNSTLIFLWLITQSFVLKTLKILIYVNVLENKINEKVMVLNIF